MNEEDWVELLREAHGEPIDPAHYAAVRARVLAELGRERRPLWRWTWVRGLAAAVAVVAVMVAVTLIPRPKPVERGAPTAFVGPAPTVSVGPPAFLVYGPATPMIAVRTPIPVRRRPRALAQARQEGRPGGLPHQEPVVIKLLTDDPNVVIYWIGA
jgi:hypothetical protein